MPSMCLSEPDSNSKASKELYDAIYYATNGNDVVVDLGKIKRLLENGANPNWINPEPQKDVSILGNWTWSVSYEKNNNTYQKGIEAFGLLFKHGAKLQACDDGILFIPISNGRYELVKLFLEHGASAIFWPKGQLGGRGFNATPIISATANGHEKVIELLVEHGAGRLDEEKAVQIRFVEAARREDVELLKTLVKKGARVNKEDHHSHTALINALQDFYEEATYRKVVYLLGIGANVNQMGEEFINLGKTLPLHRAVYMSSFAFSPDNKNWRNNPKYSKLILEELLKRGAHVSSRDGCGKTPLHIAAKINNVVAAKMLIDGGAKLMDKDDEGKTPLDYAESGEMTKLLKTYGAKEQ